MPVPKADMLGFSIAQPRTDGIYLKRLPDNGFHLLRFCQWDDGIRAFWCDAEKDHHFHEPILLSLPLADNDPLSPPEAALADALRRAFLLPKALFSQVTYSFELQRHDDSHWALTSPGQALPKVLAVGPDSASLQLDGGTPFSFVRLGAVTGAIVDTPVPPVYQALLRGSPRGSPNRGCYPQPTGGWRNSSGCSVQ